MNKEKKSTDEFWNFFEKSLNATIEKNIPTKMTFKKFQWPGSPLPTRKIIRKRDRF